MPGQQHHRRKRRSGRTRIGNTGLRYLLSECGWAVARTRGTYLSAQYWRLARRIGNKKAAIAVGHSILVIAWHLLTNDTDYDELGGDYFLRRHDNPTHQRDRHVKALRELGYQVTLAEAG